MKNKLKSIHFVGIKGVGMTPLAIIAKQAGIRVTGSDLSDRFITDVSLEKEGIEIFEGFSKAHINTNLSLVITTGAHQGLDNVEVKEAKNLNIPVWTQGEAVGKFMDGGIFGRSFDGVSVSGSHGKTTTAAMVATILKENSLDPSFLIGTGSIQSLGSPGHYGKGKFFIAEADEYATEPKYDKTPKFLWQKPKIGVITNIEFDHPDIYPSMSEIRKAFVDFANNIKKDGALIACMDDFETSGLIKGYKNRVITFGFSKQADFNIERISIEEDRMFFWAASKGTMLGEFILNVTGEHNALNALCSLCVCLELGLSVEKIKKGLAAFKGTKRRAEFIGTLPSGATVYDDYAHHPTEIKKTLRAFRETYPNKKIVCIFQPHTYSRTKNLFEQFISSFSDADTVLLTDIYPSLREKADNTVSSKLIADNMSKLHKNVYYYPKLEDVVKYLGQKEFGKEFIILTMGAGDVYKVAESLVKKN